MIFFIIKYFTWIVLIWLNFIFSPFISRTIIFYFILNNSILISHLLYSKLKSHFKFLISIKYYFSMFFCPYFIDLEDSEF